MASQLRFGSRYSQELPGFHQGDVPLVGQEGSRERAQFKRMVVDAQRSLQLNPTTP